MLRFFVIAILIISFSFSKCPNSNYTVQIEAHKNKSSISQKLLDSIKKHGYKYDIVYRNGWYRVFVGCYDSKKVALKNLDKIQKDTCRYKAYVTKMMYKKRYKQKVKMKNIVIDDIKFNRDRVMGIIQDDGIDLTKCETDDIFSEAKGYSKDPY